MEDRINILIPTYKRVEMLKECIEAAENNADTPIAFTFLLHVDDKDTFDFLEGYNFKGFKHIIFDDYETPNFAKMYNKLYDFSPYANHIIGMLEDDMVFKTKGWDTAIINTMAAAKGRGVVYCNDDFEMFEKLCVNIFVTREYVGATGGQFMWDTDPPQWIDRVWHQVAAGYGGLHYLPDVLCRHNHSIRTGRNDEAQKRLGPVKRITGVDNIPAYAAECIKNLKKYYGV